MKLEDLPKALKRKLDENLPRPSEIIKLEIPEEHKDHIRVHYIYNNKTYRALIKRIIGKHKIY